MPTLSTLLNNNFTGASGYSGYSGVGITSPLRNTVIQEPKVVVSATDIDVSTGSYFTKTINSNTTFTISNVPPSGNTTALILDLTNGGSNTVYWWANTKWTGGNAPTLTASGRDVLAFFTHDGGTIWNGFVVGLDVK